MKPHHPALMLATALMFFAVAVRADGEDRISQPGHYEGYSSARYDGWQLASRYVPVRDGTRLAVDIIRPTRDGKVVDDRLPVLWMHTPYNRRAKGGPSAAEVYPGAPVDLVKHGYVVAVADFRGLYGSFGTNDLFNFGNFLEPAWTDAYDITEWLATQPWSSGKIGMWGCSATGASQLQAAATMPPSLKAIFALSPGYDGYEFFHHGGAPINMPLPPGTAANPAPVAERDALASPVDGPDGDALLRQAVEQHEDLRFNAFFVSELGIPYRDSRHPVLGDWWAQSSFHTYRDEIAKSGVAIYSGANWVEAKTKLGPVQVFANTARDRRKLIIGPHGHCAWRAVAAENDFSIQTEELRFFDYWLKGIDNGVMDEPAVTYYTYNAPAGTEWQQADSWPLADAARSTLYFDDGALATRTPAAGSDRTATGAPAMTSPGSIRTAGHGLTYDSEPLTEDIQVTGHPVVQLWIDSDLPDVDATVELLDVAPDGTTQTYQMVGQLRASHRALGEPPYDNLGIPYHTHLENDVEPLAPGTPARLDIALMPMSYIFPQGHRMRVTIGFSNPDGDDGAIAVLTGGATASSITLPFIPDH